MAGNVATARAPDGILPNQAEAALPTVCDRRPCTRKRHSHASGRAICKSCQHHGAAAAARWDFVVCVFGCGRVQLVGR